MRCMQYVSSPGGTFRGHCCMKNAVEDGYCRIHTPAYALERTAKRQAASEAREANSAYGQLKVARERIAELEKMIVGYNSRHIADLNETDELLAERDGMVLVPADVVDQILVAWKLRAEDWGAMKRLEKAQQEQADPAQPQKRAKQENEQ